MNMLEALTSNGSAEILGPPRFTFMMIRQLVDVCAGDGHTIYPVEHLAKTSGVPVEAIIAAGLVNEYEGGEGKHGIEVDGEQVERMDGVWSLDVLRYAAYPLGIFSSKNGRGFEAQELTVRTREAFSFLLHNIPGVKPEGRADYADIGRIYKAFEGARVKGINR